MNRLKRESVPRSKTNIKLTWKRLWLLDLREFVFLPPSCRTGGSYIHVLMDGWRKMEDGKTYGGTESWTNRRFDEWNFPDSVRTICHAQLSKPRLRVRIQFAGPLVLIQLTEYPNELCSARGSSRWIWRPSSQDGLMGGGGCLDVWLDQSIIQFWKYTVSQAFSIKNESCCTCQRHSEENWCEVCISARCSRLREPENFNRFN